MVLRGIIPAVESIEAIGGGEAYEELGELYDAWCAEVVEDVPFYLDLARALADDLGQEHIEVIELGGGSGRIGVPLAQAGHRLTAIDASGAQLDRFARRAAAAGVAPRTALIRGDMRHLDQLVPSGSADLVLAPFRGMLHVAAGRDQMFAAIRRALRPGGALAFDAFHPTAEQVGVTHGRWLHRREELTRSGRWRFQERARYLPEAAAEPGGLKLELDVRCRWRASRRGRRMDFLPFADPAEGEPHERHTLLELQLVPAERWAESLTGAGFTIDATYGWFDARPLEPDDDDSVWVARRP